ncbi:hypothetical protein CL634_07080 [bacterium]|nr:hypothetical protein [bacterium]|tara:strand:+ start:332 stop:919 length:588 start_codon:yes stop_codon:yes gene_type:complete
MAAKKKIKNNQFSSFLDRRLQFLIALIVIVIFGFGYYYLLGPKYKNVSFIGGSDLASLEQSYQTAQGNLQALKKLDSDFQSLGQETIDRLSRALPLKPDKAGLFTQLEALASSNGFGLASIDIQEGEAVAGDGTNVLGVNQLNLSFLLRGGDYNSLQTFLDDMEAHLRIFDVASINFVGEGGSYQVQMVTYYQAL